jgi:hypothetical protein
LSISFRALVNLYIQTPNQLPKCGSTCHSVLFTPPVPLPRLLRPISSAPSPFVGFTRQVPPRRGSGSRALRGTVAARDGAARRTSRRRQSRGDAASEVHGRLPGAACSSRPRGLPATTPTIAPSAPAPTPPGGDPEALGEACSYLLGEMRRPLLLRPLARPARVQAHRRVSPDGLLLPRRRWMGLPLSLTLSIGAGALRAATGGSRDHRRVDLATSAVEDGCGSEVRTRMAEEQGIFGRGARRRRESSFRRTNPTMSFCCLVQW